MNCSTNTDHVKAPGQTEFSILLHIVSELFVISGVGGHKEESLEILLESSEVFLNEYFQIFLSEGCGCIGVEQGQNVSARVAKSDLLEINKQPFLRDLTATSSRILK